MKKQLVLSILALLSSATSAEGVILNCDQSDLLFPKQTLSDNTESLDVTADRSEVTKKDLYELSGNVSISSSEYYLAADEVNIKRSSKTSTAIGNVKFQDDELMLVGNKAILKKQDGATHTTLEQVKFHYPESKINGQAQKITNNGTKQVFDSVSLTLCPVGNTDWSMKADQITLDSTANIGIAKDVTVEFLGVPIFYLPHYQWVPKGRSSGFLTPSFGVYDESSANEGTSYQVKIPYYFNIAPNRDFLLTLNQLSSRGNVIEGKYRQLIAETNYWKDGRLEVEGHYLNEDDITSDKRWFIDSKINLLVNEKTNVNIKTNRVSDSNYFKDIAHDNTSASSLLSEIDVSYNDDDRNLTVSGFAETEQLINSGSASYTRAPELSISKNFKGMNNRNIDLSLVSTKFEHKSSDNNTTGLRTHAQIKLERLISTNAYSLTPSLNLSTTDYSLDNSADQNRSIYSFEVDSKLLLEREVSIFSTDLVQTLTPRLFYSYAPKKNQSALPSFDSTDKDGSYESLFSGRKFTGIDRISNANNFTFGLESDFINEETSDTYLSLKTAQKFYLDDQDNVQVEYPLNIPELGVSVVLQDNTLDQPFFKMKTTGSYQFKIGDKVGIIEVVELRQSNYSELGAEEAWKLMLKNPPLLLDVRTKGEFSQGYIKGAVLIPLQELQARSGELEQYQNQPILIYCATGNRSTTASKILLDQGYKDVMNLRLGIMGWASKGYNIQF